MEFSVREGALEKQRTGCIAVGVYAGSKLSRAARELDRATHGAIREILKQSRMLASPLVVGGRNLIGVIIEPTHLNVQKADGWYARDYLRKQF